MTDGAYLDLLKFAVPETIVLVTALAVLTADLLGMRELTVRVRTTVGALISCAGCAVGIGWILLFPEHANYQEGMFIIDPTTRALKVALLLLSGFTALLSVRADFTRHVGDVPGAGVASHHRDDVPGQRRGHPDDFHLARIDQPVALRPGGLQQTQSAVGGGGSKILLVWRDGGGVHVVRAEPAIRNFRSDKPERNWGGDPRAQAGPAAAACARYDGGWVGF